MIKREITQAEIENTTKKLAWFEKNTSGEDKKEAKTHALGYVKTDPSLFANFFFKNEKGERFRVYPYQDLILNDKSKRVLLCIARQTGKTQTVCVLALFYAYWHNNSTVLVMSKTREQAQQVVKRTRDILNSARFTTWRDSLKKGDRESQHEIILTNSTKSTSRIISVSPTDAARGYVADLVIGDEAAFWENGDYIFNQVLAPTVLKTKGQLFLISTPKARTGFFWEAYNHPEFWSIYHFDWRVCPHIDPADIELARSTTTALEFASEYEARFVANISAYFPSELIKLAVDEGAGIPKYIEAGKAVIGVDFGKIMDNSVIMVGTSEKDSEGKEVIKVIERIVKPLGTAYAAVMAELEELNRKYRPAKMILDKSGVGEAPTELLKAKGLPVEGVSFSWKSKKDVLGNLRILFEQKRIRIPNDKDLINQLEIMEYEYGDVNIMIHAPEGEHDDEVLALALMAWGLTGKSEIKFFIVDSQLKKPIGREQVTMRKGTLTFCDKCQIYYYANSNPHICVTNSL